MQPKLTGNKYNDMCAHVGTITEVCGQHPDLLNEFMEQFYHLTAKTMDRVRGRNVEKGDLIGEFVS